MSDLFHEEIPSEFIGEVLSVMNQASRHTFQVLTERPERIVKMNDSLTRSENIWMGTSIEWELYRWMYRADSLRAVSARTRFLSLEPLLRPLPELSLDGLDWVIVRGRIRTRGEAHGGILGA